MARPVQIIIAGTGDAENTRLMLETVRTAVIPGKTVMLVDGPDTRKKLAKRRPFIENVGMIQGKPSTIRHSMDRCVLVFVKAPERGKVKTRLARRLSPDIAANLYRCFTADILETLNRGGHFVNICYHPPETENIIVQWLGTGYAYQPQQGRDLGERMADAFVKVFSGGWDMAVLIGTDFPDLPGAVIDEAFQGLVDQGAVIGPAEDGGYYLIGFRSTAFLPEIFENIPWSTPDVFPKTLDIFLKKNHAVHILPQWLDIDEYEDLEQFIRNHKKRPATAKNTLKFLSANGFM